MRYFRKYAPTTAVSLSNGSSIKFPSADGVIGYVAIDDPAVCAEFEAHMRAQRFGISEVPHDEFADFLPKKRNGLKPNFQREAFAPGQMANLALESNRLTSASAAAAVSDVKVVPRNPLPDTPFTPGGQPLATMAQPATPENPGAPLVPDFRPPTGRRGKRTPKTT